MSEKMIKKINDNIIQWSSSIFPWTNVYGLVRSIMAISTALTLAFNGASIFFRPASGIDEYPICPQQIPSIFCTVPNNYFYLDLIRWLCVFLLVIVASGWRPRITGVIHWWITYSLQGSGLIIDGGEQVGAVFTLLLIPITLTDPRKWHWENSNKIHGPTNQYFRIIALVTFIVIRLQVSIIYFHSFVAKLGVEEWINGTAVYYYAQNPMLGFPSWLKDLFDFILTTNLVLIPTWGTLIVQFLLFAAILAPKKNWKLILIVGLFMHELFALMFGLISFSLTMAAVLILYLRPIENEFKFKHIKNLYRKTNLYIKGGDAHVEKIS